MTAVLVLAFQTVWTQTTAFYMDYLKKFLSLVPENGNHSNVSNKQTKIMIKKLYVKKKKNHWANPLSSLNLILYSETQGCSY